VNYCRLTQSIHFLKPDFTQHELEQFWRYIKCNGQGNFMRWGKSHLTYQLPYTFNHMIKFCTVISSSCEIRFELVLEKEDTKTPDHNSFYWHVFLKSPSPTVTNRGIQNGKIQRCSILCTECPKLGGYAINRVITSRSYEKRVPRKHFEWSVSFSVTECAAVKNKRPHTFNFNRFLTKVLCW